MAFTITGKAVAIFTADGDQAEIIKFTFRGLRGSYPGADARNGQCFIRYHFNGPTKIEAAFPEPGKEIIALIFIIKAELLQANGDIGKAVAVLSVFSPDIFPNCLYVLINGWKMNTECFC